jgi:hypothetical protein
VYQEKDGTGNIISEFETITTQAPFIHYSAEELRVADYLHSRRYCSAQTPYFVPSFLKHVFTRGEAPRSQTSTPWFYAPVSQSSTRTTLTLSNNQGWNFSIAVGKRYVWTAAPVVQADAEGEITVKMPMQRTAFQTYVADPLAKEVLVVVKSTPGFRPTALSGIFVEGRSGIELWITLATASVPASFSPAPTWRWGFDVDLGFLVPFYKTLRVTHLMFYPSFPAHAVGSGNVAPVMEPFPDGGPAKGLAGLFPGMQFTAMSRRFYCEEMVWEGKRLWPLVAVGSI